MRYLCLIVIAGLLFNACSHIDDDKKRDHHNENFELENFESSIKVINIEVDRFDFEDMYDDYDEEIEIDAHFSVRKNNVWVIEDEKVEIEIKGALSAELPLKSIGVKFDDAYDNSNRDLIDPVLLPFHQIEELKSIRLRNSGNDFEHTMIKDIAYTHLAIDAGMDLELMYYEQVAVFVNEEFYGVMNLRSEVNAHGVSRLYDVKKENITLAKMADDGELLFKDGDFGRLQNIVDAIEGGNYDYLTSQIDINNFIDYMAFEAYIGNRDWPKNNVRFYAIDDGLFRFILFDLDLAVTQDITKAPLDVINNPVSNKITDLFNVLYDNDSFKMAFDQRLAFLIESGILDKSLFNQIVDDQRLFISDLMPLQIEKYPSLGSYTEWLLRVDQMKDFFEIRQESLN